MTRDGAIGSQSSPQDAGTVNSDTRDFDSAENSYDFVLSRIWKVAHFNSGVAMYGNSRQSLSASPRAG